MGEATMRVIKSAGFILGIGIIYGCIKFAFTGEFVSSDTLIGSVYWGATGAFVYSRFGGDA